MDALTNWEILQRVALSLLAGSIIGLEREWKNKPAGIRTYALVCEGSALFMIAGVLLSREALGADPTRIASTIVQGVGFIAGGVIFTLGARVQGLTTAAGLWVVAAIGLAVGAGFFALAAIGVVASMFALVPMRWLEDSFFQSERQRPGSSEEDDTETNGQANRQ